VDRCTAERLRQGWRSLDFRVERERVSRKARIKPDLSIQYLIKVGGFPAQVTCLTQGNELARNGG
jgi:hypothetical protein